MILSLLIIAVLVMFFVLALQSRSGAPPGPVDGRLARCPSAPNCVGSEYPDDKSHYIPPLPYATGTADDALARVRSAIQAMGGEVRQEGEGYLAATFSSRVFGFVDDLEVRVDREARVIHVRSASRVGRSDLGVNRKRVERLREIYTRGPA